MLRMKLIHKSPDTHKVSRREIHLALDKLANAPGPVPIGALGKIGANVEVHFGVGGGIIPRAPFPKRPPEGQSRRPAVETDAPDELGRRRKICRSDAKPVIAYSGRQIQDAARSLAVF